MKSRLFFCFSLLSYSLVFLTGCPGYGDVLLLDKEAVVSMVGENVCFWVYDSAKHKPRIISDVRGSTTDVFSSITETSSAAFISPEEGWIFISWRTLTPGIDEAIQPS